VPSETQIKPSGKLENLLVSLNKLYYIFSFKSTSNHQQSKFHPLFCNVCEEEFDTFQVMRQHKIANHERETGNDAM
jgi:hypothetical protein